MMFCRLQDTECMEDNSRAGSKSTSEKMHNCAVLRWQGRSLEAGTIPQCPLGKHLLCGRGSGH